MVDQKSALGKQLFDVPVRKREAQIPADSEEDYLRFELPPFEKTRNRRHEQEHRPSLPRGDCKVATLHPEETQIFADAIRGHIVQTGIGQDILPIALLACQWRGRRQAGTDRVGQPRAPFGAVVLIAQKKSFDMPRFVNYMAARIDILCIYEYIFNDLHLRFSRDCTRF